MFVLPVPGDLSSPTFLFFRLLVIGYLQLGVVMGHDPSGHFTAQLGPLIFFSSKLYRIRAWPLDYLGQIWRPFTTSSYIMHTTKKLILFPFYTWLVGDEMFVHDGLKL